MPLMVNRIINNLTTPAVQFKQQKFWQKFTGVSSPAKDEFVHKTPQTLEEIKEYLDKKINAIFDKTEEALNETYVTNGYKYYKDNDRESKLISIEEEKKDIMLPIRWGYSKNPDRIKDELPLYEKILNNPEFFEQKLRYSDASKYDYISHKNIKYNKYTTLGKELLYSLAYQTETPEKLKLLDRFLDTKPDNFKEIKLFQNILKQKNLFPEKTDLLKKILFKPSLKEQKTFYICYDRSIHDLGLETLAELKTPEQVKVLEQIIDDKNKHKLFGAFIGSTLKKMNKEQTEMFSELIENNDYLNKIHDSKFLLESFGDFDDKQSLEMFKTYLTTTNEVYKTHIPQKIAPFSEEYNDMRSMLAIYAKEEKPHTIEILNRFLDDKKLYENPVLLDDFGCLLDVAQTKEGAKIVNKVFDNEKLCNNKKFIQKLTGIFSLEKDGKMQKMRDLYQKYTGQYV